MNEVKVLDHGYVTLIERWGSDERIIESARMSTHKGFEGWGPIPCTGLHNVPDRPNHIEIHLLDGWLGNGLGEAHTQINPCSKCRGTGFVDGDERLLKFLYEHKHFTPFEMGGLTIEVQAPIMVFREWHRHRTQSYNELSARYTPIPDVNYVPTPERCLMVSGSNKQAGKIAGANELTHEVALRWLESLQEVYQHAENVYAQGLLDGIPKELARLPVPVGRYSRMRASANLRNWFQFLSLRLPENAQWEIRQFSEVVGNIVATEFPRSWALFKS